jgi:hypothetical protein
MVLSAPSLKLNTFFSKKFVLLFRVVVKIFVRSGMNNEFRLRSALFPEM